MGTVAASLPAPRAARYGRNARTRTTPPQKPRAQGLNQYVALEPKLLVAEGVGLILEQRDVLGANVLVALGKKVEKDELLQITENINK